MGHTPEPCDDADSPQSEDLDAILLSLLGCALAEVFHHILGGKNVTRPKAIGIRAIAIINEIRPDLLDGRSLLSLARDAGCTRAALSHIATTFRDRVGKFSHPLIADRARDLYAQRARAVHNGTWQTPLHRQLRTQQEARHSNRNGKIKIEIRESANV